MYISLDALGDIKRVADGYGRNFLLRQGLAVLATAGAMKQVDAIRAKAVTRRAALNEEMGSVADVLNPDHGLPLRQSRRNW